LKNQTYQAFRKLTYMRLIVLFKNLIVSLLVLITLSVSAQDIHLTQYYHNPLLLNPAQAGLACNWRAGINYRSQWGSVTSPYKTTAGYFDIPVFLNRSRSAALGLGVGIFNDVAGTGALTTMDIMPTVALHLGFGDEDPQRYHFSIGLQPSYRQKKVDINKLSWESQWDGNIIDPYRSNGETSLQTGTVGAFDLNSGFQFTAVPSDNLSFFVGASIFHLLAPVESFYQSTTNKLDSRKVINLGAKYTVNEKLTVIPSVLIMAQAKASEKNLGAEVNYNLTGEEDAFAIFGGAFYRWKDATQLMGGIELNRFRVALSYDINMSGLHNVSRYRGGFELALMYKAPCYPPRFIPPPPQLVCPRF
jgi:type IX secretion system PorP/SprF family membrane protein